MDNELKNIINYINMGLEKFAKIDDKMSPLISENKLLNDSIKLANETADNRYNFITLLDENELKTLVASTDKTSDEQKDYLAPLIFIKKMLELNSKCKLDEKTQIPLLQELLGLINLKIDDNNKKIEISKNAFDNSKEKYRHLKEKLEKSIILSEDDFDTVDEVIEKCDLPDYGNKLLDAMKYLNEYNMALLQKTNNQAEEKENNISDLEKGQKLKELMTLLGYDYDKFDEYSKTMLLKAKDLDKLQEFINYLITSQFNNYFNKTNIHGLCYLLINSNEDSIKTMLDTLKNIYHFDDEDIKGLVNRATPIFDDGAYNNAVNNINILLKYGVPLSAFKNIIKDSISFIYNNSETLAQNLEYLKSKGVDVNKLLADSKSCLKTGPERMVSNLDILEKYGFDISKSTDFKSYTVLAGENIEDMLDGFIELGLNEYIHESPSKTLSSLKTLLIKRIYYSFKKGLPVWSNRKNAYQKYLIKPISLPNTYNDEEIGKEMPENSRKTNYLYDAIIADQGKTLSEEEIAELVDKYPILNKCESLKSSGDNSSLGKIKSQTELMFKDKIISRLKTYRAFNILTSKDVEPNEALLYALTYNSILTEEEYNNITAVVTSKVGEKTL